MKQVVLFVTLFLQIVGMLLHMVAIWNCFGVKHVDQLFPASDVAK